MMDVAFSEDVRLGVNVRFTVRCAKTGALKRQWTVHNKITDDGLDTVRDQMGNANHDWSHIAIGDDATAPAAGDTALYNEVGRYEITSMRRDDKTVEYILFLGQDDANGETLREAGIFNNQFSVGNLLSRVLVSPAITKTADVTVTIEWEITISRA